MKNTARKPMNKFGLEEIRAIRDRWAEMPWEEVKAEQNRSAARVLRRMGRIKDAEAVENATAP